jgi:hypothetical protein
MSNHHHGRAAAALLTTTTSTKHHDVCFFCFFRFENLLWTHHAYLSNLKHKYSTVPSPFRHRTATIPWYDTVRSKGGVFFVYPMTIHFCS